MSAEELIRFVDGEGLPEERTRIRRHLRRCRPCLELTRGLRGTTRELELRFAELDDAAAAASLPASFQAVQRLRAARPRAHAPRMLPRAAAVLALAAIGAAAASPLRSRVLDWLGGEGGAAPVSVPRSSPPSSRPAPVAVPEEEYRFVPRGETFIVHFDGAQDESSLTLRVSDGQEAVLRMAAAASAHPPVFVMPNGVRIGAAGAGGVRYGITVPPSVRTIVLRTGGGEPPTTLSARTVREQGEAWIGLGRKR